MLLIVNSMPKSGSTWFHTFVVRCASALGHPGPHEAVASTGAYLNYRGNPGPLEGPNFALLLAAARATTFAIKAHAGPSPDVRTALDAGTARMIFLIRHPRDVVRSTLTYGAFCREKGLDEPYKDIDRPDQAADFVAPSVEWATEWSRVGPPGGVLRYEDLFASDAALLRAAGALLGGTTPAFAAVLERMRPASLSGDERDYLRVNLRKTPPALPLPVAERCAAWALRLGYPDDGRRHPLVAP